MNADERFDVARARVETPGCTEVVHFNNAGAGLMPRKVHAEFLPFDAIGSLFGGGGTEQSFDAQEQLARAERFRDIILRAQLPPVDRRELDRLLETLWRYVPSKP